MATAQEKMTEAASKITEHKDKAAAIGAVYKFILAGDGGGTWVMNLKDNPGVTEGEGDAACTIKMAASPTTWTCSRAAPTASSSSSRASSKIEGDMGLAMKLQKLTEVLK